MSRQSAITQIFGQEYAQLKKIISEKNSGIPDYVVQSVAGDAISSRINSENWLDFSYQYRHSYVYERQFRLYYVDHFLRILDDSRRIYSECRCVKQNVTDSSRVDNVIKMNGRYLSVEVKLSVPLERNIVTQVSKYCNDDYVYLSKNEKRYVTGDRFYSNYVLIIDRFNAFIYDDRTGDITDIYDLDDIQTISDIYTFKRTLMDVLTEVG